MKIIKKKKKKKGEKGDTIAVTANYEFPFRVPQFFPFPLSALPSSHLFPISKVSVSLFRMLFRVNILLLIVLLSYY
jgi:hypothetical protein